MSNPANVIFMFNPHFREIAVVKKKENYTTRFVKRPNYKKEIRQQLKTTDQ